MAGNNIMRPQSILQPLDHLSEESADADILKECAINAMSSMTAMCAAVYKACMDRLCGGDTFEYK